VGLCLDTGHLAFGGADPVDVAETYAARITHLHLKDVRVAALQSPSRSTPNSSRSSRRLRADTKRPHMKSS
jgi:inosose dehydratase